MQPTAALPAALKDSLTSSRQRFITVGILFLFMMLHQADKMVISSLTTPIMAFFNIDEAQMGFALTGAIVAGAICYPLWGFLYDRYARPRILALAAVVWSATTWLSGIAPTFPTFVASRASTGIDDAAYPGIYSLVSDTFGPTRRGRVIGVLQLTTVVGPILGMGLATALRDSLGWRGVFFITGGLGLLAAAVILIGVREAPRGATEPELSGKAGNSRRSFTWAAVRQLGRKPAFILLFIQQFIYVFPFNAIGFWYYRYLEVERALPAGQVMMTVGVFGVLSTVGSVLAGLLGDLAFRRTPRGRMWVSMGGVLMLVIFFTGALRVPAEDFSLFFILQTIGSLFAGFVYPNATTTIQDIVEPEIRSTAHAVMGLADTGGSALAPLLMGVLAVGASLQSAMLRITTIGWVGGLLLLACVAVVLPRDVHALRQALKERSGTA